MVSETASYTYEPVLKLNRELAVANARLALALHAMVEHGISLPSELVDWYKLWHSNPVSTESAPPCPYARSETDGPS